VRAQHAGGALWNERLCGRGAEGPQLMRKPLGRYKGDPVAVGHAVLWQDENGIELGSFQEPGYDTRLIQPRWTEGTACLRFVDPYGDTVFNQLQIPVLIEELDAVAARASDADLEASVRKLIEFLRGCDEIHTYLKVIGD